MCVSVCVCASKLCGYAAIPPNIAQHALVVVVYYE